MLTQARSFRNKSGQIFALALAAFFLLVAAGFSYAGDSKKEGKENKEQARRVQQMQQKMSVLEQEKSELDGKLKDTSDQLTQAKRSAIAVSQKKAALESALKTSEEEVTALNSKLATSQQEIAAVKKTLADTQETLHQTEDSKRRLEATLKMRSEALVACDTKNESLYRTGGALIKKYQEKSCFDNFLQSEPVTQLNRVNIENQVEEYRQQLEQERNSQKLEEARNQKRQQAEADRRAIEKADMELAEQKRVEQEKLQRLKAKQQGNLDKISRKLSNIFKDIEW